MERRNKLIIAYKTGCFCVYLFIVSCSPHKKRSNTDIGAKETTDLSTPSKLRHHTPPHLVLAREAKGGGGMGGYLYRKGS